MKNKLLLTFTKEYLILKYNQWKTKEFGQTDQILLNS